MTPPNIGPHPENFLLRKINEQAQKLPELGKIPAQYSLLLLHL